MAGGRPSKYRAEYVRQAHKLCLLGATDAELAAFFQVDVTTIENWKGAHEEFFRALKEGKDQADAEVAHKLYRRALGYSHRAVKIVADAKTGAEHVVPFTERYPPDTTAAIFWLKNRQSAKWRDKQDVDIKVSRNPTDLTDAELADIAAGSGTRAPGAESGTGKPSQVH